MRMATGVRRQRFDLANSHGAQLYFCRMLEMIREDCSLFDSITGGQLPMVGKKDCAFVAKGIQIKSPSSSPMGRPGHSEATHSPRRT